MCCEKTEFHKEETFETVNYVHLLEKQPELHQVKTDENANCMNMFREDHTFHKLTTESVNIYEYVERRPGTSHCIKNN